MEVREWDGADKNVEGHGDDAVEVSGEAAAPLEWNMWYCTPDVGRSAAPLEWNMGAWGPLDRPHFHPDQCSIAHPAAADDCRRTRLRLLV